MVSEFTLQKWTCFLKSSQLKSAAFTPLKLPSWIQSNYSVQVWSMSYTERCCVFYEMWGSSRKTTKDNIKETKLSFLSLKLSKSCLISKTNKKKWTSLCNFEKSIVHLQWTILCNIFTLKNTYISQVAAVWEVRRCRRIQSTLFIPKG